MLNPSKAGSASQHHHRPTSQLQQACPKYAEGSKQRRRPNRRDSGQVHGEPVLWAGMLGRHRVRYMEQLFSVRCLALCFSPFPSLCFSVFNYRTGNAADAPWCPNNRLCLHAVGALRARDLHKAHHIKGSVAHGLLDRPAMWPPDTNRASLPLNTRVLACMGDYCSSPCGRCLILVVSTRMKPLNSVQSVTWAGSRATVFSRPFTAIGAVLFSRAKARLARRAGRLITN